MNRARRLGLLGVVTLLLAALASWNCGAVASGAATEVQPPAAATGQVVLDTSDFWRMHHTMKAPVVDDGGKFRPIVSCGVSGTGGGKYFPTLLAQETPAPPAEWAGAAFDDGAWVRSTAAGSCRSPYLARLCLRGWFNVADPAKAPVLTLAVDYYGGAAVYLNGQEVGRQHLPSGADLAQAYPKEVFVTEQGKPIGLRGYELLPSDQLTPELSRRIALRTRRLEMKLPPAALRQGTNVLAIEVVRAPYDKVIDEQKVTLDSHGKTDVHDLSWNTCELRRVQLQSAAQGTVSGAARPRGVQVWNSNPMAVDFDLDFAASAEPLGPIRLAGCRNGSFSGKVVVGSDQPIKGLQVTVGDLAGPGGAIPAARIQIRYALPWSSVPLATVANGEPTPYPAEAAPLMALTETPPAEVPVRAKESKPPDVTQISSGTARRRAIAEARYLDLPGQPAPIFGAVAPVWVTVNVPATARPGTYAGRVAIKVDGRQVADVPLEIRVADWALPDPREFRTWVELIQAPDTTAAEYNLPLWSDRHWELIAKSLKFVGEVGSKVIYVPLIAESNAGNAQSMVRWIDQGNGKYSYDFSTMERYLDLAEQALGKPQLVVFNVWDRYLVREGNLQRLRSSTKLAVDGPIVTVVRPDGKIERLMLPDYPEPQSKALWQPLFTELHQRMAKRGLAKAMALGMISDFWASKEQAAFLADVSGGLPWLNASHYYQNSFHGGIAPYAYQATFFGTRFGYGRSLHGWQNPVLQADFERIALDRFSISKWRMLPALAVTGNCRGIGRLGADTWYLKDKTGRRTTRVWERFPAANWGYLNCDSSTLAAGPDGPVASQRYEALREGLQESEALVLIDQALTDAGQKAKLGADLASRCEAAMTEHNESMWRSLLTWQSGARIGLDATQWRGLPAAVGHTWFVGSNWQQRSLELFDLAGQVQRKLGEK